MNGWELLFEHFDIILEGFGKTLLLFGISVISVGILGMIAILLLEGKQNNFRRILLWSIDIMRMLPFLIFAYLLYYGLPTFGIRMDAWTVGIVGLSLYHGAYFAEILRGLRSNLPRGQVEAALAHGYSKRKMMLFLIIPQLLLKGGPLIGNQLIYMLKDTAFLTIITVQELTGAASSVQSIYFIPVQAFLAAIALYWIVSFTIERLMKKVDKVAVSRGMGYE